jgi:phenylpropionate dioxygenase-like ring-hydroxylating dioxygenase large terminal subunit
METVFADGWNLAATLDEIDERPGYLSRTVASTPIVLTIDSSGELRVFLNACRHRGFPVADGKGCAETLRCSYHAWTYDLHGQLRRIPRGDREANLDVSTLNLIPVRHHIWQRLVFVSLGDAAPFEEQFPRLPELADVHGLHFRDFQYFTSATATVNANWKAWAENLNECYHCSAIHSKSFADAWETRSDSYRWLCSDKLIAQFAVPNQRAHYFPQATGAMANVFLWPNTAISTDDYVGVAATITPKSPTVTELTSHVYVRRHVRAAVLREWLEMYDQTLREDIVAVERQQQSLASHGLPPGTLLPASEPGVVRFQELVRSSYGGENVDPAITRYATHRAIR